MKKNEWDFGANLQKCAEMVSALASDAHQPTKSFLYSPGLVLPLPLAKSRGSIANDSTVNNDMHAIFVPERQCTHTRVQENLLAPATNYGANYYLRAQT